MFVPDQRKTVLLIDDDLNQLALRRRVLELSGFNVVTAGTAYRGLELFEAKAPDAVVLDYEMPRMSGGVLAGKIRRANDAIPILMLSGCPSVPNSALTAVNALLPKALHPAVLLEIIECLVEKEEAFA